MTNKRAVGFWVIMIFSIFMLVMLLVGQMMSFINYDFTVSLGLQESVDVVGEMGVAINKGFGVGDTIIYIPLLIAGLVGLWLRKEWGIFTMASALGITAYWPLVYIFFFFFAKGAPGFNFTDFMSLTIFLSATAVYALWGLWYLYKNRKLLVEK